MTNTHIILSGLLMSFLLAVSCSDTEKKNLRPLNPNGDSELALLMRDMFDEAMDIKKQINNDERLRIKLDHEAILTADATEPEKAASPEYKAFADAYLKTVNNLKTASPAQRLDHYDDLVNQCSTCHQALCPGPLVRIKKLR
ncbi:MAG: hypothetical protein HKN16_09400 [Saprospiraceae bacterium]|nr:hypothetical protein [Saprospiraceae bacterium]